LPKNKPKEDYFEPIVKNMFEYINKSLDLLDEPQYSIIYFYTALELLFKARLLNEHWSLVISNFEHGKSTFENFKNGASQSVYLNDAATRIRNLFKDLPNKYEYNFKEIKEERNKLVHFPITDIAKEKKKLLQVLYKAWYYMLFLLQKQWKDIFISFDQDIKLIDRKIKGNNEFLKEKSNILIEKYPNKYTMQTCCFCGYNATISIESYYDDEVKSCKCDVCENYFFDIGENFIYQELTPRLISEVEDELKAEDFIILEDEIHINNLIITDNILPPEEIFDNTYIQSEKLEGFVDLELLLSLDHCNLGYESQSKSYSFTVDFEIDLEASTEKFTVKRTL